MKLVLVLCLVSVALARPAEDEKSASVVTLDNVLREDQSFDVTFETSNGILREDSGVSYPGNEPETGNYVMSGSYEFVHPDGQVHTITWIADEKGFRPQGDFIPKITEQVNIQDA